jgi:hypothetical protein
MARNSHHPTNNSSESPLVVPRKHYLLPLPSSLLNRYIPPGPKAGFHNQPDARSLAAPSSLVHKLLTHPQGYLMCPPTTRNRLIHLLIVRRTPPLRHLCRYSGSWFKCVALMGQNACEQR